ATSPIESPKTIQGAEEGASLAPPGDATQAHAMRAEEARTSDRIGGVPPPTTVKGAVKTMLKAISGEKATVLVDKLGERAAFERAGVRLYELALVKAEVFPSWEG